MLACVKYSNHNVRKQSSIFPKLVGSRRRVKTEVPANNNNLYIASPRKQGFFTKQQQQMQFLQRMKKARDIILSHQKKSKTDLEKKQYKSMIQEFNPEEYKHSKLKSFSQVVYNIKTPNKKNLKQNNQNNELYNDKLLRECRSQFKPDQKQRQKHQRKYILYTSNKRKQKTERVDSMNEKLLFEDKINTPHNFVNSKKSNKIDSAQKFLMNMDLSYEVINSDGSQLMEKLINHQKEKRKKSKSNQKHEKEQKINNQQQLSNEEQKVIKFPFESQDIQVSKIKLRRFHNRKKCLMNKKQKKEEMKKLNKSAQNMELMRYQEEEDELLGHYNKSVLEKKKEKDEIKVKNKKIKLNMSRYINEPTFKIDGWDPTDTVDFQAF